MARGSQDIVSNIVAMLRCTGTVVANLIVHCSIQWKSVWKSGRVGPAVTAGACYPLAPRNLRPISLRAAESAQKILDQQVADFTMGIEEVSTGNDASANLTDKLALDYGDGLR